MARLGIVALRDFRHTFRCPPVLAARDVLGEVQAEVDCGGDVASPLRDFVERGLGSFTIHIGYGWSRANYGVIRRLRCSRVSVANPVFRVPLMKYSEA